MVKKSKIDILNKMTKTQLKQAISEYTGPHRMYQRLIAMELILEGHTHEKVAELVGVKYNTIYRWAKLCEKYGIEGLKPNFGGGRPSYLTDEQKKDLDEYLSDKENLNYKDMHQIILSKYHVDYSMKQIGVLRKQLGYNYARRYPIFRQHSPEADEEFINDLKKANITHDDIITMFDGSTFLSTPYTIRTLIKKGKEHTSEVNAKRIKVNVLGSLSINGRSSLTITKSSTAPEIAISFIQHRFDNTENFINVNSLLEIIDRVKIPEEDYDRLFNKNNKSIDNFIEELEKSMGLNKDKQTVHIAEEIKKEYKTKSKNSLSKKRQIYGEFIIKILETYNIEENMQKERKIHLILDKFSSNRSGIAKIVAKILNINLIYLPAYSPHLNLIEQVWRILKYEVKHYYIQSEEFLEHIIENNYYNQVVLFSLKEGWEEEYLSKVW